ncbi:hypothetical protein [Novosphingobium sp.]|uniref:hypothetical protein n=1 Tax=Novosphingobium sp. TaxID=1874826 RepID=UPI0025E15738|nr:hypothetical protein [Novosphingobium sp.]
MTKDHGNIADWHKQPRSITRRPRLTLSEWEQPASFENIQLNQRPVVDRGSSILCFAVNRWHPIIPQKCRL